MIKLMWRRSLLSIIVSISWIFWPILQSVMIIRWYIIGLDILIIAVVAFMIGIVCDVIIIIVKVMIVWLIWWEGMLGWILIRYIRMIILWILLEFLALLLCKEKINPRLGEYIFGDCRILFACISKDCSFSLVEEVNVEKLRVLLVWGCIFSRRTVRRVRRRDGRRGRKGCVFLFYKIEIDGGYSDRTREMRFVKPLSNSIVRDRWINTEANEMLWWRFLEFLFMFEARLTWRIDYF